MIDRGDLSAEIEQENLYGAIETIAKSCKYEGKPLIMATENLVTMTNNNQPTKSEIISLGHSLSINTDCIMLSEETAVSNNFENILKWLYKFLNKNKFEKIDNKPFYKDSELWDAFSLIPKVPTIIITLSGKALFNAIKTGNYDLHIITNSSNIRTICNFFKKEIKVTLMNVKNKIPSKIIYDYALQNYKKLFKYNRYICAVYVSQPFHGAEADNITIINKHKIIKFIKQNKI